LISILDNAEEQTNARRIEMARFLFEKARVFEQAEKLIDRHRERASEIAEKIQPEPLRRLFCYLIDTVLNESDIRKPHEHPTAIITYDIATKPTSSTR
jgi:hypothetical protein